MGLSNLNLLTTQAGVSVDPVLVNLPRYLHHESHGHSVQSTQAHQVQQDNRNERVEIKNVVHASNLEQNINDNGNMNNNDLTYLAVNPSNHGETSSNIRASTPISVSNRVLEHTQNIAVAMRESVNDKDRLSPSALFTDQLVRESSQESLCLRY